MKMLCPAPSSLPFCGIKQGTDPWAVEYPRAPRAPIKSIGRNTPILQEIISVLDAELADTEYALDLLESHFHDRLLLDVGDINIVGQYAEQLRLNISHEECALVLDYVAAQKMVVVTVDHVEQVVWDLFGNRFMEP